MVFYFHCYLGKGSIFTNIFQMGWTHHRVTIESLIYLLSPETKVPSRVEIDWELCCFFQLGGAQFYYGIYERFACKLYCISGWWFQIFFMFIPIIWGRWTHFDEHIFQMGWFNHQPDIDCWEFPHYFQQPFSYEIWRNPQALLDYEKHIKSCKAIVENAGFLAPNETV